ncbi:MAG: 4a-hydroxytetrahydrobiopterin dehydratase [Candidatus Omnitrophica bacterium]|nr:4a-hydroxytetrahydrobiopterin dehydratase [Candidatus Omnitrophota bacterium]
MAGPERLSESQVSDSLKALPAWELKGGEITKLYKFKDFVESMAFVNRVAALAEEADHHPDILIRWNKVTLTLSTHSAGGLTQKDFNLARSIDGRRDARPG